MGSNMERLLRKIGIFKVTCGALSVLLGVFDMYMCWQPYNEDVAICGKLRDDGSLYYPCQGWNYSRLIGAIGVPLWVGKYFIATGSIALRIKIDAKCPSTETDNSLRVRAFMLLACVGAVLMGPAMIAFVSSEVLLGPFGKGYRDNGVPVMKWAVPTTAGCIGTILWALSIISVFVCCLKNTCSCLGNDGDSEKDIALLAVQSRSSTPDSTNGDNNNNKSSKKKDQKKDNSDDGDGKHHHHRSKDGAHGHHRRHGHKHNRKHSSHDDVLHEDNISEIENRIETRRKSSKSKRTTSSKIKHAQSGNKWEVRRNSGFSASSVVLEVGKRHKPQGSSRDRRNIGEEAESAA